MAFNPNDPRQTAGTPMSPTFAPPGLGTSPANANDTIIDLPLQALLAQILGAMPTAPQGGTGVPQYGMRGGPAPQPGQFPRGPAGPTPGVGAPNYTARGGPAPRSTLSLPNGPSGAQRLAESGILLGGQGAGGTMGLARGLPDVNALTSGGPSAISDLYSRIPGGSGIGRLLSMFGGGPAAAAGAPAPPSTPPPPVQGAPVPGYEDTVRNDAPGPAPPPAEPVPPPVADKPAGNYGLAATTGGQQNVGVSPGQPPPIVPPAASLLSTVAADRQPLNPAELANLAAVGGGQAPASPSGSNIGAALAGIKAMAPPPEQRISSPSAPRMPDQVNTNIILELLNKLGMSVGGPGGGAALGSLGRAGGTR
jgi:hypothetical protein